MIAQMRDAGAFAFAIGQGMGRGAEAGDARKDFQCPRAGPSAGRRRPIAAASGAPSAHRSARRSLAGRRSCAPTMSCNRKAQKSRSILPAAGTASTSNRRVCLAHQLRHFGDRLDRRRSHCWRPSPPPGRGPCLRATQRASLPDRSRHLPSQPDAGRAPRESVPPAGRPWPAPMNARWLKRRCG